MTTVITQPPTPQQMSALKGKKLPVSELLAMFGVRVRNHQTVPVIVDALRQVGLGTVPSFTTCNLGANVFVVAAEQADATEADAEEEDFQPGTLPQQSFKIKDVPSARAGVDSVPSTAPLHHAIHMMRQKNYSQLPVIDGTSHLKGVITWSSVAACYEQGKAPSLGTTMLTDDLPVAEVHQALFSHLAAVAEHGYVLVRSNSGAIEGIITGADITGRFHTLAQPFFLLGEIEFRLRCCLGPKLNGEPVRAIQPKYRATGEISDLMFGDYLKLLDGDQPKKELRANADKNWATLGWTTVNRAQFVYQLDQVRRIRNRIAHFDDTPLTPQQIDELMQFSGLLKQFL
ncbi:CBS domain-containing protein [Plantactinospora sp. CA-294935]|uniref:CBS domain-containing protein n=1 Tax=Plantactinospora sp. CA-294935 TaxID=3240012 RepID=UPI003D8DDE28